MRKINNNWRKTRKRVEVTFDYLTDRVLISFLESQGDMSAYIRNLILIEYLKYYKEKEGE